MHQLFSSWILLALAATASAQTRDTLLPIVDPTLAGMEAVVQEQLRQSLDAVRDLATQDGVADVEAGEAFGTLGQLYLAYDLTTPAEASLRNARALDPGDFRWSYLLGSLYQGERELDGAVESFQTALEIDGSHLPAWIRLGNVHLALDDAESAATAFDRARQIAPDEAAVWAGLGKSAAARGEHAKALEYFEAALERQPQATALHYARGLALRELGRIDDAREALRLRGDEDTAFPDPIAQELLRLATGSGIHLMYGNKALRAGNLEAAARRYAQAVEANPDSADAHQSMASVLLRLDDRPRAIEHFSTALALRPDSPSLHYNLGTALVDAGQRDQAIRHFTAALELAPDYNNARFNLANALGQAGRHAEALPHWQKLLDVEGDDHATRFYAAQTFHQLGRHAEAVDLLQGLVDEDPTRERAQKLLVHARLGWASGLARDGNFDAAQTHYRAILDVDPGHREARFALTMALLLAERYPEAAQSLEDGTAQLPDDGALAHLHARFLATCPDDSLRDGTRALDLALRLFRPQPRPDVAETVAMAYAELGRFDDAVAWQERLIQEAERAGAGHMLPPLNTRLEAYRRGEPARAPWLAAQDSPKEP